MGHSVVVLLQPQIWEPKFEFLGANGQVYVHNFASDVAGHFRRGLKLRAGITKR